MLPVTFSVGGLVAALLSTCICFFSKRRFAAQQEEKTSALAAQADRAARGETQGPPALQQLSSGSGGAAPALQRDSLQQSLLQPILEEGSDAALAILPSQQVEELPQCVQAFLARSVRDGRPWKLFTLVQLGRMKMDEKGGWKEATAMQRVCPLEPAFVWTASASLAPLVSIKGYDSFVDGKGYCAWQLWGSVPAASGSGWELEQSLRLRWLAEAACFPQALMPSRFLRWEAIKGQDHEAEAVLTYGGVSVRATFTFDRCSRIMRMRTRDFLRRLPNGTFDSSGVWQVDYSGHMLFGLSPQGPVIHEEIFTQSGIFIPTQVEASWVFPDGRCWVSASFTIAKVTAE